MNKFFIGLISGTSMDAVDAVLVDFNSLKPQLIATRKQPLSNELRNELIALCSPGFNEINRLGALDIQVGQLFAETANSLLCEAKINSQQVQAIGSHGQTIRHHPQKKYPFTLQIGDPNVIAEKTKITTVADFRRRDLTKGGQGAPLTPAFHNCLFRDKRHDRVILNLGGIANITWLPADSSLPVIGFDTGPANTLLDMWANKHIKKIFDGNGNWAASGNTNFDLLKIFLTDPYFSLLPPKSTGREYFNENWLNLMLDKLPHPLSPVDIQATLCELTAQSIVEAIKKIVHKKSMVLICGGGIHNRYLVERIKIHCAEYTIHSTEEFGVHPDWVEAMAFAWLAQQTLAGKPGNLPSVTGAKTLGILGGVYYSNGK